MVPEIRYAKTTHGVHIAYQVLGDGPIDLAYVPGFVSHLEFAWQHAAVARYYRRLATFSRLILIDRRGTGMSDRVPDHDLPTLELRMDDMRAVLDEVGSERAALVGEFDGGAMCALFAATYPDRTRALVLIGAEARGSWAPDYPWAWTDEEWDEEDRQAEVDWGTESYVRRQTAVWAPSLARDEFVGWYATLLRLGASPGAGLAIGRMEREMDVRHVLDAIHVPTLVVHRSEGSAFPREEAAFIAERVAGAELAEVPGADQLPWAGDQDSLLEAIERFLASAREEETEFDRVLATVLFTDIVGSTERAATLGDHGWRAVVDRHHTVVRGLLARYRGTEVDTAGDGFFATFDGPARAVRCAEAIVSAVEALGLEVRAGVHTGEVETIDNKVGGIAVAIGSRVAALAGPSEVLVSSTVKDLVAGSGLVFEDRGEHELKGVPGPWRLYRVVRPADKHGRAAPVPPSPLTRG